MIEQRREQGRASKVMSTKRERDALELFFDGMAEYLFYHPDAGPSAIMRDIPEVDFRAVNGEAVMLYEEAVRRAVRMEAEEPFSLDRVREKILLAHKML